MALTVLFSQRAENALVEAYAWYSSESRALGDSFLAETDQLVVRIGRAPRLFPAVYRDVRRGRLRRFPYAMFYRVLDDQVWVLAVVHARRDPRVWPVREPRPVYARVCQAA